jgi:hypothetical protein
MRQKSSVIFQARKMTGKGSREAIVAELGDFSSKLVQAKVSETPISQVEVCACDPNHTQNI